ncbi:MAG: sleB [Oscillospiraceae bacterium]|nr:sleB [Oscillospiraceae bacterium]
MSNKTINALRVMVIVVLNLFVISAVLAFSRSASVDTLSKVGSRGTEVRAIQQELKDRSLYTGAVDGVFGSLTKNAVVKFQKQKGLAADGVAGPQTLRALGVSVGTAPSATQANINLLARIISAESRAEVYLGQVAVGAVILNRIEHPSFPDTLSGVIYQPGAFTAVTDGQMQQPVASSCYRAAKDALNGQDPSGGAIYYYNPKKTSNKWIRSRPVIKRIGDHVFCS